jgi:hypothetical protein
LEAVIEWVWRCNGKWRSSNFRYTLRGHHRPSLEMHLETKIEWIQRCSMIVMIKRVWTYTWMPWSSRCAVGIGDRDWLNLEISWQAVMSWVSNALIGGCDRASLEMQLHMAIELTQRCTGRPSLSEFGNAIGDRDWVGSEIHWEGYDWASWGIHLEAVIHGLQVVLALDSHWLLSSGSGLESSWNLDNLFYPSKNRNATKHGVFCVVPHFRILRSLPRIQFLSSDRMILWYVRKKCCIQCSNTTNSPICTIR